MEDRPPNGAGGTDDTNDTEAAWREIVENYGDRADVPPEEYADLPVLGFTAPSAEPAAYAEDEDDDPDDDDPDDSYDLYDDEDRFVPPPAPPLPRTTPDRLVAWLGALGSPVVVVVLLLAQVSVPRLLGWALVIAFVGGFGYLVATMPREPRDPWDDGSRV